MDSNTIVGLSVGVGAFGILTVALMLYFVKSIKSGKVLELSLMSLTKAFTNSFCATIILCIVLIYVVDHHNCIVCSCEGLKCLKNTS